MTRHEQNDTPTQQLPAIRGNTGVRTDLQTIVGVGTVVAGAIVWCAFMYRDVQGLKESDHNKSVKIDAITDQLASVKDDVKHIRWILDPTASRPVLVKPAQGNP